MQASTAANFGGNFRLENSSLTFCCPQCRLVIELDGAQHVERVQRDEWRSALLARHDYRVLRFWNEEIINHIDGVLEDIG
jgi:very-short-patch-repair endonuclease